MTIDQFNKPVLQVLRKEISEALDAVGKKHGIVLTLGSIGFDANNFSTKVTGSVTNPATGEALSPEYTALLQIGKVVLGEKFDPNKTYALQGKLIKFCGYNSRRPRMPLTYTDVATGKRYKMAEDYARHVVGAA